MISKYFKESEVECRCGECHGVPNDKILAVADAIREGWGSGVDCTSGYRCEKYATYLRIHGVPAAVHSAHNTGEAMDLRPVNGKMQDFQNYVRSRLVELNIRMEDPVSTPSWCHVDLRSVPVGKSRVFKP